MTQKDTSVQSVSGSYGLYKGTLTVTSSSTTSDTTHKFSITGVTKMQQASGWGVETVLSGAVSGSAAGYTSSVSSGYANVPGTTVSKTLKVKRTHSKQTKTIYIQSRGKTVSGWGAAYSQTSKVGISVTIPALSSHTISYNANGGSGAPSSQTKWQGESLVLSKTIPTKSNNTFVGWNTKQDLTGTTYAPGATFKTNISANLTLYAMWQQEDTPPDPQTVNPIGIKVTNDSSGYDSAELTLKVQDSSVLRFSQIPETINNGNYQINISSLTKLMSPVISARLSAARQQQQRQPQQIARNSTNWTKVVNAAVPISSFSESGSSVTVDRMLAILAFCGKYYYSSSAAIAEYNQLLSNGIVPLGTSKIVFIPGGAMIATNGRYIYPGVLYPEEVVTPFTKISDDEEIASQSPVGTWKFADGERFYNQNDTLTLIKISDSAIGLSSSSTLNDFVTFFGTYGASSPESYIKTGLYNFSAIMASEDAVSAPLVDEEGNEFTLPQLNTEESIDASFTAESSSTDRHILSVSYQQAQSRSHWQPVIIERAPDRDSDNHEDAPVDDAYFYNGQRRIYWDSINDVLGELVCFGHYNTGYFDYTWDSSAEKWIQGDEHPGVDIYNLYRQVFEDDAGNPYDEVHVRAYAAIPDPTKELEVGYQDNDNKWHWYPISSARIGFANWADSGWTVNGVQVKNTDIENDGLLGGWHESANTKLPTGMYQYFKSDKDIDADIWPADSAGRPVVGPGSFINAFADPSGDVSGRIIITLPCTRYLPNNGDANKVKRFQQSPLVAWEYKTVGGTSRYHSLNESGTAHPGQYIRCFDADGETKIMDINEFPAIPSFPIVSTSKPTKQFQKGTLRVVDPCDAESKESSDYSVWYNAPSYCTNETYPFRYSFCYVYTNPLGHTLASQWRTVYANLGAEDLSTATGGFRITQWVPENDGVHDYDAITGVDIFYTKDDYRSMAFAGHQDFPDGPDGLVGRQWVYDWYGASSDTSEWSNAGLTLPDENTTRGPECEWMDYIDNKCYFYGGAVKHRLYIGGRVGHELCTTTSVGGGWLDINPGSGVELKKVLKFKTYNGANIVTILASHANHRHVRRYNLIENNIAITNELTGRGYAFEEVSNVVGAISHWGAGVWAEGLYTLSRYGLHLTTQQMENTNNLRAQLVSDPISPLFTESIAKFMHRSEMVFSNEQIYFVLSTHDLDDETGEHIQKPSEIVFCYDVGAKGWYTYTIDGKYNLLSVFNFDYEGNKEGIGIITPDVIYLIPNGGQVDNEWPTPEEYDDDTYPDDFKYHSDRSILETGELSLRVPPASYQTLSQLEFRFDYFIGDITIDITGVDYYGRHFNVQKTVSEYELMAEYPVYVRVDKLLQTYNIRIEGYAHYRLTHILAKTYPASNKIDLVYGFDSDNRYEARPKYYIDESTGDKVYLTQREDHKRIAEDHHAVRNYNDLRECIVP